MLSGRMKVVILLQTISSLAFHGLALALRDIHHTVVATYEVGTNFEVRASAVGVIAT
jgi:hypothetical protein